jgi:hypothetical protein
MERSWVAYIELDPNIKINRLSLLYFYWESV